MNCEKFDYIENIRQKLLNNDRLSDAEFRTVISALHESKECFQEPYYELVYHDKYDRVERRIMEPVRSYTYDSSLKALEELNRREFERIVAEPIRFNIDEFKLPTKEEIKKMINKEFGVSGTYTWNLYKKIIFSGPCTIILWTDGSKTIAKASSGDAFDPEKGVAICFMKKMIGHTETNKILRKASKDFYDEIAREANRQLDEELRKATFPLPKGITFRPFNFDVSMDNNKVIKVKEEEQK